MSKLNLSQIQNIETDRILGRDTAGSGTIEELSLTTVATMLGLSNYQLIPEVVSASKTAELNVYYVNVATSTYTDPSPTEGRGFIVFVRNGTATVGGTAYSTAGTIIYRIFHSGAWANYVFTSGVNTEFIQDVVGAMATDSAEIDFTYDDGANTLSAALVAGSIDETKLDTSVNASLDLADSSLQSSDIGVTVQGYDADTAKYDDATANFTGILQEGGNNVITTADTASTTAEGIVEIATGPEIDLGNNDNKAISPGTVKASYVGRKPVSIQVTDGSSAISTGDGKAYLRITEDLDGMDIIGVSAVLTAPSTSGTPTIQIARGRQASPTTAHAFVDVLSTPVTIDANEYDSKDATTAFVINTSNDDLATGDLLRVDIDGVGSAPTAVLTVNIRFQLP